VSSLSEAPVEIPIELSLEGYQQTASDIRGLLFSINSVRNLAQDVMRMAAEPSLQQAFWLGIQFAAATRRMGRLAEEAGLGDVFGAAKMALGVLPVPVVGVAAAAVVGTAVVGAILIHNSEQERIFAEWQRRQEDTARHQGLIP